MIILDRTRLTEHSQPEKYLVPEARRRKYDGNDAYRQCRCFDKLVQSGDKPVLVDFWATWCGPCRMLAPVIEELAGEHPEVQFAKLDVDQVPDVAMRFGVSAIPTVVLFKAGKEVQRFVGVEPKGAYEQALAAL